MSMKTKILNPIDLQDLNTQQMLKQALISGSLVVFPTETVYGIGGYATLDTAAESIYTAKGRPKDNPLIVHVAHFDQIEKYAYIDHSAVYTLAKAFWPGPITLILRKKDTISTSITGGLSTVAIRIPSHPIARTLLEATGLPIAAPSANLSGKPSSTTFEHVLNDFDGIVDFIINGGDATIGLESTVIDMTTEVPIILRPGSITQVMLEQTLQQLVLDQSETLINDIPKAPGMKYRHYAPVAMLHVVKGHPTKIKTYLQKQLKQDLSIAILGPSDIITLLNDGILFDLGPRDDLNKIAFNLFSAFRQLDQLEIKKAYIIAIPETGLGKAIMNRIMKAANHSVIDTDQL